MPRALCKNLHAQEAEAILLTTRGGNPPEFLNWIHSSSPAGWRWERHGLAPSDAATRGLFPGDGRGVVARKASVPLYFLFAPSKNSE